jgi:hypothetical protein
VTSVLRYCSSDIELWESTEGACDWVQNYVKSSNLPCPSQVAPLQSGDSRSLEKAASETDDSLIGKRGRVEVSTTQGHTTSMFAKMFETAIEMVLDRGLL